MFETHVEADEMMSWPMMLKLCKSANTLESSTTSVVSSNKKMGTRTVR